MKYSEPKSIVLIKLDAINSEYKRARDLHDIIFLLDKRLELFTLQEYEEMGLLCVDLARLYEFKPSYKNDSMLQGCFYDDINLLESIFRRGTTYQDKMPKKEDNGKISDLESLMQENKRLKERIFTMQECEFQKDLQVMKDIAVYELVNEKLRKKLAEFMPPISNLGILKKLVRF